MRSMLPVLVIFILSVPFTDSAHAHIDSESPDPVTNTRELLVRAKVEAREAHSRYFGTDWDWLVSTASVEELAAVKAQRDDRSHLRATRMVVRAARKALRQGRRDDQ